ncbi:ATP-dependent nuclease [Paenibacillus wynnii]|uniref:ATP-dependent nuclease n=1 Tax=Paenibacillus wynnii TaxID=268407 RepID=UPI00279342A3|nr:AAA family ATPase [Paenibacillus wynnii]MDQ0194931.1 putative ATP-dependent endonuclease of OLD family [Paenibacillus wynnii]
MKLHSLKLEGFRRHLKTEVLFSDATFLIGENNIGKSSILNALNILLNDVKKLNEDDFFSLREEGLTVNTRGVETITLIAEFRDIPEEAKGWIGFKGRVLSFTNDDGELDYRIIYKKTFKPNIDCIVEMREQSKKMKVDFEQCLTIQDYIDAGLDTSTILEKIAHIAPTKKLTQKEHELIKELEDLYDFDNQNEVWFTNPGGIPANVLTKLPKFLLIPAQDKIDELSGTSGTLISTLTQLFNDVREGSDNYRQAQLYLDLLAAELNPEDGESEFGQMMFELNKTVSDVFPNTGIKAITNLAEADKVIKPQFKISMFSNITTAVNMQGTGIIRSAVFALLRYRNIRENRKGAGHSRPLLIGFEEPEIYLHPNAAKQMRETIYELASAPSNQIVCTTHSPYMIDLSKKPQQILNCLSRCNSTHRIGLRELSVERLNCTSFNTSEEFKKLQDEDKTYVKMLLKIDDYVSRVFFSKNVLIVEGDTEDIVLRETINRMPTVVKKDIECNWQIIKARGKAAIISLVKYLKAMGINPVVIHDKDEGVKRAEVFNEPILAAIGEEENRIMLINCIEDILGYPAPSNEKPYIAFKYINENWTENWESISSHWRLIIESVFKDSFSLIVSEDHQTVTDKVAATIEKSQ